MNLRQQLLIACVMASALLILCQGCSDNPVAMGQAPERNSLPAVVRVATLDEIQRHCPNTPNARGCAVPDYRKGFCYVFIPNDAPTWLLAHELLHCAGFDKVTDRK